MKAQKINTINEIRGFTLIEAAISMLILGLLLAPMLMIYNNYVERQKLATSYENIYQAVDALQNYRRMNGFYPCPAPMNADRTDADYGLASTCTAAPFNTLTPGNCTDGICIETSVRTLANPRVVAGALPFRDLQMDEEDTFDPYGSRLYYAITESMTDIATLNDNNGAIAVRNAAGNPVATPDGSAVYVVLHYGPTQKGGYSRDGARIASCTGTELDIENCNDGFTTGTGPSTNAVYLASQRNDAPGTNYFDDEILFFSQISDPTWKRTVADPEDIEELSPNFVGVATAGPTDDLDVRSATAGVDSVYVNGPTGAPNTGGTLITDSICDPTGANCFPPSLIAGDNTLGAPNGMKCGSGLYMTGIENGGPKCEEVAVICPATTPVMRGIDGAGNPDCVALPGSSCAPEMRTVCGTNDVSLPAAADTVTSANFALGACRNIQYRCNTGTWNVLSDTGSCTFTPVVTSSGPINCSTVGPGWTGTYTTTTTTTCGGGSGTVSTFSTDCTCVGAVVNESENCSVVLGGGWTGGPATRTVTYSPPTCSASGSTWDTSACVCAGSTVQTELCSNPIVGKGPNWLGNATRTTTRSLPTCDPVVGGWDTTGCTCDTTPDVTYPDHVCTNPVCEIPNPADKDEFTATIDPTTCVANAATMTHTGSCMPKAFKWVDVGSSGAAAASLPPSPNYVGDGCSCSEHSATTSSTVSCFYSTDPAHNIYKCKCQ